MTKGKNLNIWLPMAVFLLALHAGPTPALAQQCELAKLLASDGAASDYFGYSVAISGSTAIIGAYLDDDGGQSGSAYIFRYNGSSWVEEAKLVASDSAEGDRFGYSVAISGTIAVIGAPLDDDNSSNSGSTYIFRYNGSSWVEEVELVASDGAVNDRFGWSVAISGSTAVIGAYGNDDNGESSGSAYIFRYNGSSWVEEQKLLASDAGGWDSFGWSVAISSSTTIIGAYGNSDDGGQSGSAYIFRYDGSSWVEEQKLLASDANGWDSFGYSVAIWGGTAAIGAYGNSDNGAASGSAYVFRYNGSSWVEEQKLLASDGAGGDLFGYSVAIWDGTAVIGAYSDDDNGSASGSAYVFRYDGSSWVEEAKLLALDGVQGDSFAYSVAVWGDTAIIGAYKDDDNGGDSGSAYVFGPGQTGDFDDDCDVDFGDFAILALAWLTGSEDAQWNPDCDISEPKDSVINWLDLDVFTENWLAGK